MQQRTDTPALPTSDGIGETLAARYWLVQPATPGGGVIAADIVSRFAVPAPDARRIAATVTELARICREATR